MKQAIGGNKLAAVLFCEVALCRLRAKSAPYSLQGQPVPSTSFVRASEHSVSGIVLSSRETCFAFTTRQNSLSCEIAEGAVFCGDGVGKRDVIGFLLRTILIY